jgi:predicted transcriptional regulator
MSKDTRISVHLDQETDRILEYLARELNSPKTWIIRRLVHEEKKRQTKTSKAEVATAK